MNKLLEELERIDKRLEELRVEWKQGSLGMRKYIEAGARIHKDRKAFLLKKIEEEEKNGAKQDHLLTT